MSLFFSHPSIKVSRARHDESTSNLVRHADSCDPSDTATSRAMTSFAHGSTYSAPKLRMKLALWAVRRHRPFAIVADPEFIEILTDLNNKVIVPSPTTLSRDVREFFNMSRLKVATILQVGFSLYYSSWQRVDINIHSLAVLPGAASPLRRWLDITKRHRVSWGNCSLGR
jgi:hypothetical protein